MNYTFLFETFFKVLKGIPTTLLITALTLIISTPLAFMVAIIRKNRVRVLHRILAIYVSFIRGTPIIVQIVIVYNTIPTLLNILVKTYDLDFKVFEINPLLYAVIVFVLNITATMSEVIRSAFLTVDRGQYEAALCSGLTSFEAYIRIVIPQAMVSAIPNFCSLTVELIKMTSLAFAMTIRDVTAIAKIEAASGYNFIEAYLDVFVVYIVICLTVEKIFISAEKRLGYYKHPAAA